MADWSLTAAFATLLFLAAQGALALSAAGLRATGTVLAAVVVTVVAASWLLAARLDRSGFERLGGDPGDAVSFAWLLVLYLPLGFLPALAAVEELAGPAVDGRLLLPAATAVFAPVAGWLAFYGGRERLGADEVFFTRLVGTWLVVGFGGGLLAGVSGELSGVTPATPGEVGWFLLAQLAGLAAAFLGAEPSA